MKRSAFGRVAAALLAVQIGLAWAGGESGAESATGETRATASRTVKERLSSKASDDQRVEVSVHLQGGAERSARALKGHPKRATAIEVRRLVPRQSACGTAARIALIKVAGSCGLAIWGAPRNRSGKAADRYPLTKMKGVPRACNSSARG